MSDGLLGRIAAAVICLTLALCVLSVVGAGLYATASALVCVLLFVALREATR